jgi:hypothetical protein
MAGQVTPPVSVSPASASSVTSPILTIPALNRFGRVILHENIRRQIEILRLTVPPQAEEQWRSG